MRAVLTEELSDASYAVRSAAGAAAGLELARAERFDLVITDLRMPEMDGIMLIREARKIPSCRFIPILVLTTESQAAKRIEAKAAGATGWLVKPVTTETLIQVLGKVIPE